MRLLGAHFYTQFIWLFMYLSLSQERRETEGLGCLSEGAPQVGLQVRVSLSLSLSFHRFCDRFLLFSFFHIQLFLYAYFLWVFNCVEQLREGAAIERGVWVLTHTLTSALITNANAKFMFAQNEIMLNAFLTLCSPQKVQREREIERQSVREAKISWERDPWPNSFACGMWQVWQGCPRNGSIKIIAQLDCRLNKVVWWIK